MSNGDDVLDNWEEIDEAGLTNALQKLQAERKTQQKQKDTRLQNNDCAKQWSPSQSTSASASVTLISTNTASSTSPNLFTLSNVDFPTPAIAATVPMKLLQRNANTNNASSGNTTATATGSSTVGSLKSPLDDMATSFQPVMMLLNKPADEYQSTTYAPSTNLQTVKILRRPTQSMEPRNNDMKPRQPIKTLQQREQEYAEARLRILGSAKNPEDDLGDMNAPVNSSSSATAPAAITVTTAASTNNTYKGNGSSPKSNQSGGGNVGGGAPLNIYNNYYNQQQQQANFFYMQQQKQHQQKLQPAYNNRSLASLLPLPLPATLQSQHQHPQQQPQQQTWSPVVGGSVSSSALRQQQQENILRLPRGPDGSAGFQMRR